MVLQIKFPHKMKFTITAQSQKREEEKVYYVTLALFLRTNQKQTLTASKIFLSAFVCAVSLWLLIMAA